MSSRVRLAWLVALPLALLLPAQATAGPVYDIRANWGDTLLRPGDGNPGTAEAQFALWIRNDGDSAGAEDLQAVDQLPGGVVATGVHWPDPQIEDAWEEEGPLCTGLGTSTVTCALPGALVETELAAPGSKPDGSHGISPSPAGYLTPVFIDASVPADANGIATNVATVSGGGAPTAVDEDQVRFESEPSLFGVVEGSFNADAFNGAFPGGLPSRQASDHPFELRTNFDITAETGVNDGPGGDGTRYITSTGQLRTVRATLPLGMIGNPEAVPKCDPADFAENGALANATACPPDTQIGYLNGYANDGNANYGAGALVGFSGSWVALNRVALYNLEPPKGVPADFGFHAGGLVQGHIYPTPDAAEGYAITSVVPNISSIAQVRGSEVTIWGVPADPAHDRFRWYSKKQEDNTVLGAPWGSAPIRPFLTNPMDCGEENGGMRIVLDSYEHPGKYSEEVENDSPLNVSGCDDRRFRFEPEVSLQPSDRAAGAPTGLDVHLEVPQQDDEVDQAADLYAANGKVRAISTPPIKKAVVAFPEGMTLNPSAAQGLQACSSAQIGLGTDRPAICPEASRYGTLTLHTPIFPADAPLSGHVYVARQSENPFGSLLALYLVIEEPDRGILVKLAGRLDLDPNTGQITTTFDDLPQFPVSDMQMSVKGGVRAGLVNPATCGTKTINATLYSWHEPTTPHSLSSSYEVTRNPDGSPCQASLGGRPFAPDFEAGTANNLAGSFSPFSARLTRTDQDQELSRLRISLPQGLVASFAGIERCSDAQIAQAASRTAAGQGALEQASPSCPASAQLGSATAGAGVGVPLSYVSGKVYLAGPYEGAPLSVVAIVPAVVGPYDLGVSVVRTALRVDPERVSGVAETDPLPQVLHGVPVRLRDLRVNLDRSRFTLNPTSCAEKQIEATATGAGGDLFSSADDTTAELSSRFQAAECASLAFRPRLSFRLFGPTKRGGHPRLKAVYRPRAGQANAARVSVALPHSEFLDQAHIKTVCTRVQFAAKRCPKGSIYGFVKAKSPLFDELFKGPIYLRSSNNPLPDLVAALHGPPSLPLEVELAGRIDSVNGGIRNTFALVPDVPVSWAVFSFRGARKGLLVNSTDLCKGAHRATAKLWGQNGRRQTLRPKLRASCGKQGKRRHGRHRRR